MTRILAGAVVALVLALPAAGDPAWLAEHATLYLPMDRTPDGPVAWFGQAIREPMPFSRPSPAWLPESGLVAAGEPRYVAGRLGEAIVFEGGQYQWADRGTTNWLAPALADPGETAESAWQAVGSARLARATPGLTGTGALRVEAGVGDGIAGAVRLEHPRVTHLASGWVRGVAGQPVVRLRVAAGDWLVEGEPLAVADVWQPVFCRFDLPAEVSGEALRVEVVAEVAGAFLFDAAMVEQANKFYHNRQSPSTWVPGLSHRYLERTAVPAWPELFDPAAGSLAVWAKPLGQQTNGCIFAAGSGWTVPLKLELNGTAVNAILGQRRLNLGTALAETWTHFALTWEGSRLTGYRDGQQVASGAAGDDLWPADLVGARFLLGIGHDDLGYFARSTGANAALDELVLADAPLPAALLAACAARPEAVAAAWAPPAVDLSAVRRSYGREEPASELAVTGDGGAQVSLRLDGEALPDRRLAPGRLEAGRHWLEVAVTAGTSTRHSRRAVWVGPAKQADRFHVIGWNVAEANLAAFAEAGGTASNSGPDDLSAVLRERDGLFGMWLYGNLGSLPPGADRRLRVTGPDGKPGRADLFAAGVRDPALAAAAGAAESTLRHPHLRWVLLNTEHGLPLDFGPEAARLAKERTGIDFAWWPLSQAVLRSYSPQEIEAAEAGLGEPADVGAAPSVARPFNLLDSRYLPTEHQPREGVIEPDNPLYQFTGWWYRERSLAAWNESLAEVFRAANPSIEPLFDPILRGPSLRWYQTMALAQEWVYYEDPLAMIPVQEALTTVCRGLAMRPTGMPQFLFKAGTAAPISVTPPADLVTSASWLACTRPIEAMTYWGWQLVFGPGEMWTPEQTAEYFAGLDWGQARAKLQAEKPKSPHLWHPGALEAFAELSRELFGPFGELIRRWDNLPRRLAVVKSLASELFSPERWWTAHRFGPPQMAIAHLGVPFDLLYDEDLTAERLAGYEAVLLPAVEVLPRPALDALRAVAGEVQIIAEPAFAPHLPGSVGLEEWTTAGLRATLQRVGAVEAMALLPEGGAAVVNALRLGEAVFLPVVNDRREPGPLLGQWGKVNERGVAQTVQVQLPRQAWDHEAVYELTSSHRMTAPASSVIAVDLPPAGGRILAAYPTPLGRIVLSLAGDASSLEVGVRALDGTDQPWPHPVPISLVLRRPDGSRDDHSRDLLLVGGQTSLTVTLPSTGGAGQWTAHLRERLTGAEQVAALTVPGP